MATRWTLPTPEQFHPKGRVGGRGSRPVRRKAWIEIALFPALALLLFAAAAWAGPALSAPGSGAGPQVTKIDLPTFDGAYAIWGATGNDARGHVWFAICADKVKIPSAHLYEMNPDSGAITDRGDVVSELERAGLHRPGEGQMKIHTRIVQAADGNLYFASMDEQGEREDGSRLPTWGSHLWRLRLPDNRWEHLFSAPQGLIALDAGGRWVYCLGYFGHMLYQYDTVSGRSSLVKVGSVDGHISRNIAADARGHVYVPRLTRAESSRTLAATLVEYDGDLKEVAQTPLGHYLAVGQYTAGGPTECHGIVALEHLNDGSICFITHAGWLYRITPQDQGPARVTEVGPIHPRGESYTASLFCADGRRYLDAVSKAKGASRFDWLRYDLETGRCESRPFNTPTPTTPPLEQALLYGSMTRDRLGNVYVVGAHWREHVPVMLRVKE